MNQEIEKLKAEGFGGFVSVESLRNSIKAVPDVRGVYVVLRTSEEAPTFLATGTGGFFEKKDPNVSVDILKANWVEGSPVVYIGKAGDPTSAATLRKRISQYIRFGQRKAVGHKGGRYIWQLADAGELLFAWKPLPDGFPSQEESRMIAEFKATHNGMRPFANLRD